MINNMNTEEIILDLSTRATALFATGDDIVAVSISSQRSVENFWQVWFEHWMDGVYIQSHKFEKSIQEGKSLNQALFLLNDWLAWEESQTLFIQNEASNIIESIGFGD